MKDLNLCFTQLNERISQRKNASDRNAEFTFSDIVNGVINNKKRSNEYANCIIDSLNVGYYGECLIAELYGLDFHNNPNAHYDLVDKRGKKYEIKTFVSNGIKEISQAELNECDYFYFVYYNRKSLEIEIRKAYKDKIILDKRLKVKDIESCSYVLRTLA